jgi:hypothetical protein
MLFCIFLRHFQEIHDQNNHRNVQELHHIALELMEFSIQNDDKHKQYQMLDQHLNKHKKKNVFPI